MASFPTSKVHRVSRRQLGRGQTIAVPPVNVVVTSAMSTATLTFGVPVIVSGPIDLHVSGGLTVVSQTQTADNVVEIVMSGAVSGKTYSIDASAPVRSFQGGVVAAVADTF